MQSCECFSPWGSIQKRPDHSTDFGCVAFVCVDSLANNPAKWLKYQQNFKPLVEGIWAIRTRETLQVYWGILGLFILAINVVCGSWYFLFCFVFICFLLFFACVLSLLLCAVCLIFIALPFFDVCCSLHFSAVVLLFSTTETKTTEAPTAKRTNKNNNKNNKNNKKNKKNKNNSPCPPAVSTLLLPTPILTFFSSPRCKYHGTQKVQMKDKFICRKVNLHVAQCLKYHQRKFDTSQRFESHVKWKVGVLKCCIYRAKTKGWISAILHRLVPCEMEGWNSKLPQQAKWKLELSMML